MQKLDSYLTKHKYPGRLIVIEGSDGSGKTTQLQLLKKYIDDNTLKKTRTVDFPQYYDSFYGKFIARYLRGEFGDLATVNPYLISFPYALDRLSAAKKMYSWLKSGKMVLLNRYTPSNLAHQSSRLKGKERETYLEWSLEFEYKENKLPVEDLVIFLYVPYTYAQKLMKNKDRAGRAYTKGKTKDIVEGNVTYLKNSEKAYLGLLERFSHWVKIDCVKNGTLMSIEEIHKEVLAVLKKKKYI